MRLYFFTMKYIICLILTIFLISCTSINQQEITGTVTDEIVVCTASGICTYNYYIKDLLLKKNGEALYCENVSAIGGGPMKREGKITCNHDFISGQKYTLSGTVEGKNFLLSK